LFALDTLDIITQLRRLPFTFRISGPVHNWFTDVSLFASEKQSPIISCEYGVPQGSVLEPLLFPLYASQDAEVVNSFEVKQTQRTPTTQLYVALHDTRGAWAGTRISVITSKSNTGKYGGNFPPEPVQFTRKYVTM
jgi:hypothetical protein